MNYIHRLILPYLNENTITYDNEQFKKLDESLIRKFTTFHESGHAYFAVKFKMEIRSVTIKREGDRYGYIDMPYPEIMKSGYADLDPSVQEIAWITENYSGIVSGLIFTDIYFPHGSLNDFEKIHRDSYDGEKYGKKLFEDIFRELNTDYAKNKINILAEELLEPPTITGARVYELLE